MRQSIEAWNKEWAKLRGPALKERRDEYHRDYLDDTLRQLLAWIDPRRHRRFLEIGCGPAILGEALARRGFQVAGLDCCIEALKAAGRVHRGLRRPSFFVGGDLNHIPLRDGSVDFLYGGGSSSISTTPWGVCASCIASWRRGVCLSTRSPIFPLAA
jgi:SAM-dependent methyltransferase